VPLSPYQPGKASSLAVALKDTDGSLLKSCSRWEGSTSLTQGRTEALKAESPPPQSLYPSFVLWVRGRNASSSPGTLQVGKPRLQDPAPTNRRLGILPAVATTATIPSLERWTPASCIPTTAVTQSRLHNADEITFDSKRALEDTRAHGYGYRFSPRDPTELRRQNWKLGDDERTGSMRIWISPSHYTANDQPPKMCLLLRKRPSPSIDRYPDGFGLVLEGSQTGFGMRTAMYRSLH